MDIAVARALHVLAIVVWIGGVSMATTVVLPALRRGALGSDKLKAFTRSSAASCGKPGRQLSSSD